MLKQLKEYCLNEIGGIKNSYHISDRGLIKGGFKDFLESSTPKDFTTLREKAKYLLGNKETGYCKVCGKRTNESHRFLDGAFVRFHDGCWQKSKEMEDLKTCDVDRELIKQLYLSGWSLGDIINSEYGVNKKNNKRVSKPFLKEVIGKDNIRNEKERMRLYERKKNKNFSLPSNSEEILKLYDAGFSILELSNKYGCQPQTIIKRLKSFGIKVNRARKSKEEKIISDFLTESGIKHDCNVKRILENRHELDIYIPDKKLAIEVNGMYWHSTNIKTSDFHANKRKQCEELGIKLLSFTDFSIRKNFSYVRELLLSLLDFNNKIHHSFIVEELDGCESEYKKFIRNNSDGLIQRNIFNKRYTIKTSTGELAALAFCYSNRERLFINNFVFYPKFEKSCLIDYLITHLEKLNYHKIYHIHSLDYGIIESKYCIKELPPSCTIFTISGDIQIPKFDKIDYSYWSGIKNIYKYYNSGNLLISNY